MDPVELRLQNFIRPEQFPYTTKTGWTYDSGDYATTMREAMRIAGYDELRREQAEKRARGEYMGIGVSFFTETVGAGPRKRHGHRRPRHGRRRRAARAPDGQGGAAHLRQDPGPGPRDDVRADRGRGARHPARGRRGRPRRHGPDAVRPRHLRQPLDAGLRRRHRDGVAQDPRQGAADRRRGARGLARRPRVGEGPLVRQGRPGEGPDDPGARARLARHAHAARGRRGPPRRGRGLRPAEPDLPVRRLHLRRRRRPGDGRDQAAALHLRRRLRRADQPDDRRGPDPRRPRRGRRHRAHAAHRLRRAGQLPERLVHGLPRAELDGGARTGSSGRR